MLRRCAKFVEVIQTESGSKNVLCVSVETQREIDVNILGYREDTRIETFRFGGR